MPAFNYRFTVRAPLAAVAEFHRDTSVLKKLSPPPILTQIHYFEPLADGSVADFTLWFGPFPVHWRAVHSQVSPAGFTDTQLRGPLKRWRHTHRFTELAPALTEVHEHIEYEHHTGWRGLISRLLLARPGLYMLFTARKYITRYYVKKSLVAAVS